MIRITLLMSKKDKESDLYLLNARNFNDIDILSMKSNIPNDFYSRIFASKTISMLDDLSVRTEEDMQSRINENYELWVIKSLEFGMPEGLDLKDQISKTRANSFFYKHFISWKNIRLLSFRTDQSNITGLIATENHNISSSDDGTVKIYDQCGILIQNITFHTSGVWALDYNKGRVISGGIDKMICIFNIEKLTSLVLTTLHKSTIRCLKTNNEFIITGGRDGLVIVWDYDGTPTHIFKEHKQTVRCIDMHKDHCLTGSYDGTVILWHFITGVIKARMKSHSSRVYCVVLGPNLAVSSSSNGTIHVSDYNGNLIYKFNDHRRIVIFLVLEYVFKEDYKSENHLISGGSEGLIYIWGLDKGNLLFSFDVHSFIVDMRLFNDILLVSTSSAISMFDMKGRRLMRKIVEFGFKIYRISISINRIIVGYRSEGEVFIKTFSIK